MGYFEIVVGIATILGAIASVYSAFSLHSIRNQINTSSNNNITNQKNIGLKNNSTSKITYNGNSPKKR